MASYEAGLYENVPIIGQGFCESKEKHTPGFYLTIKPGEYERQVTWWLPDGKEDAVERLFSALETLGFSGNSFAELDPNTNNFFDFSRFQISCECKHQAATDGSGKVYEQWQLPFAGTRDVTPLDAQQVRRLDTLFGKSMKQRFGKTPKTEQPVGKSLTADARQVLAKAKRPADPDITKANQSFDEAMAEANAESGEDGIPF